MRTVQEGPRLPQEVAASGRVSSAQTLLGLVGANKDEIIAYHAYLAADEALKAYDDQLRALGDDPGATRDDLSIAFQTWLERLRALRSVWRDDRMMEEAL